MGLDQIPKPALPIPPDKPVLSDKSNQPKQPDSAPDSDSELYDAPIEEGDEHGVQISGAPQASMMCVEAPHMARDRNVAMLNSTQ